MSATNNNTPATSQLESRSIVDRLRRPQYQLVSASRWRKWGIPAGIVLFVIGLGVALFTPININVTSQGKIVPSSRVKTVQHLEGGIVREVFVKEGETVAMGANLVTLDLGATSLNLEELTARRASMNAARIRLRAEASRQALTIAQFPADISLEIRTAELLTYRARVLELEGQLASSSGQLQMQSSRILEAKAKIAGLRTRQDIVDQQHTLTTQLAQEKLVPQNEVVASRKEVEVNRMELATTEQALKSVAGSVVEAQGKVSEVEGRFRRRAAEELLTTERLFLTVSEDYARAHTQRDRNVIKAPIAGIVKGLRSSEPGWVVKAGEPIMDIVPANAGIEVEARLSPGDRGLVQVGQKVKVKVSAYDFLRYGALDGTVQMIAADADKEGAGPSFFRMVIRTNGSALGKNNLPVTSGMTADVDVIVGSQTFAWYLLRPILKVGVEAFREP